MCALWIDKHRPRTLDDLDVQNNANEILKSICSSFSFPHLLFCGPPGSGKKTRVLAFLRAVFQCDINRMRSEYQNIKVNDKNIEIQVSSSDYHVEITPADVGNNDHHIISHFLKEVAASQTVGNVPIKVVVVNEAHRLSKFAQQALRRTMEKYARTCRIILIADSLSQIIEPIRSRCLIVRTPRIPINDLKTALYQVSNKESFNVEQSMIDIIAEESEGNLRRGINLLEMHSMQQRGGSITNILPEWERYTDQLCSIVIEQQLSSELIKTIRTHLYELLVHCVPPTEIFRRIVRQIMKKVDISIADSILSAASIYEARMQSGSKPIFHLEAFIARFICIYREYLNSIAP